MTTIEEIKYKIHMREKLIAYLKESQRLAYRRRFIVRRIFPIIRLASKLADIFYKYEMYRVSIFFGELYLKYMRKAINNCKSITLKIENLDHESELLKILIGDKDAT